MDQSLARCFLAVSLPHSVKEEVDDFVKSNQHRWVGYRLIAPNNWHLTLHFYGSLSETDIEQVKKSLPNALQNINAFELTLGGFGGFPKKEHPHVLWIGVSKGSRELNSLKNLLNDLLVDLNLKIEKRKFHPHLTIARIKNQRTPVSALESLYFEGKQVACVKEIVLFRSELKSDAAQYTPLARFQLT